MPEPIAAPPGVLVPPAALEVHAVRSSGPGGQNVNKVASKILIDNDKAVAWLRKGAQPTDRVQKLLVISGAWDSFKGGT